MNRSGNKCGNKLSPQRRKVVLLCSAVACMSSGPALLRNHLAWMGVWIGLMICVLVYAIVLLFEMKKSEL